MFVCLHSHILKDNMFLITVTILVNPWNPAGTWILMCFCTKPPSKRIYDAVVCGKGKRTGKMQHLKVEVGELFKNEVNLGWALHLNLMNWIIQLFSLTKHCTAWLFGLCLFPSCSLLLGDIGYAPSHRKNGIIMLDWNSAKDSETTPIYFNQ